LDVGTNETVRERFEQIAGQLADAA